MCMFLSARHRGVLAVLAAGVLFGTIGVVVDCLYTMKTVTAAVILFYRFLFACPVLLIWLLLRRSSVGWSANPKTLILMAAIGIAQAASQLCYFEAIREIGISLATVITICMAPVFVALLSVLWLGELLSLSTGLSLAMALAGVGLIMVPGKSYQHMADQGVLFALLSAVLFALVFLLGRRLAGQTDAVLGNFIAVACATVLLLPFVSDSAFNLDQQPLFWLLLVYLGVMTTALAYWLLMTGIKVITATAASILTLVDPLVAVLLAYVLFAERLTGTEWLGGGMLVLAFVVIAAGQRKIGATR